MVASPIGPRPPAPRAAPVACPRPVALAMALGRRPPSPTGLAALLDGRSGAPAFRRVVELVFPARAAAILAATRPDLTRGGARVAAFLAQVEADLFPVYDFDEWWYAEDVDPYDVVLRGVPFVRMGWGDEDVHELGHRDGHRLLLALCRHPDADADESSLALLESLAPLVPLDTLLRVPRGGLPPDVLHRRLDGGRFAAVADFGDWVWGRTETAFLDYDDTMEIYDADWTREVVDALVEQWRRADAILRRIDALATWLEGEPPPRFAALLRAVLQGAAGDGTGGATVDHAPPGADDDGRPRDSDAARRSDGDARTDDRRAEPEGGAADRAPGDTAPEQPLPAGNAD